MKLRTLVLISILFFTTSCKVEQKNSIVGVWKPVTLILPESVKKSKSDSNLIFMTFDQSKDMLYHFHADSSFTLESAKPSEQFNDARGTYSLNGNAIAINIYNTVLKSTIVKINSVEMHVQSNDSVTIIYEKQRGK